MSEGGVSLPSAPVRELLDLAARDVETARGEGRRLARAEVALDDFDLVAWLTRHPGQVQLYCVNRSRTLEVAAIGVADRLRYTTIDGYGQVLCEVRGRLEGLPGTPRAYGGFAFEPGQERDERWTKVGASMFLLPEVEVLRTPRGTRAAVTVPVSDDVEQRLDRIGKVLTDPAADAPNPEPPPTLVARHDEPGLETWIGEVAEVLNRIQEGEVRKVVLARRTDLRFSGPVNPATLLRGMAHGAAASYVFYVNYGGELAFLGATPEQLVHRHGREVFSEALAGTRPRGETPEADQAYARELLTDPKLIREHELVEAHVRTCLEQCCEGDLSTFGPSVLPLARLQHRLTRFSGRIRPEADDSELLAALHPTPAVAGDPVDPAREIIRRLESFDRGWYAGPIGWVSPTDIEFAVALRCGLLAGDVVSLFAGAGLVPQSLPEDEWNELNIKMDPMLNLIRHG